MRFYATQTFEGLTLQKTSLLPDKKFFLGGSCAAQTVITGEKLVRVQYGLHSPGLSTLDIYGKITHVKPIRPSSVEFVKELPQLPDRPKRRIKLHAKPDRVDLCRYILPKKNIVIKCDHTPFKEEIQKPAVSMSSRTKQKIRNKLQALFYYCQSENIPTYFLTLTFIAAVSDEKAIRIFNTYLTSLRKYQPGINYLWVAEKQQNGNLHFHVIIDRFLPVRQFNTLWSKCN